MVPTRDALTMPWWGWLFSIVMWPLLTWLLWRAFTRGVISMLGVYFDRKSSPVTFWFNVTLYGSVFLLLSVLVVSTLFRLVAGLPLP